MSTDILTADRVAREIDLLRPPLEALLTRSDIARDGLALSISADFGAGQISLGDFVIGDLSRNPYPNADIARQKRDLSARCRRAGSDVPPHLLRDGDSEWTGSAWLDGIAVGCAGLSEARDEMVAHWVAHALAAACRDATTAP
ncbi:hypothetical protein [Alloyangia pacifica]|uniref:Uncharacterized protein n=1 Tax=Alloyangia pacifica TaxID=311180 RepID=A0A1I6WFQ2_9RHOB|nr:hypothetical protein [Alloyangia pacifica]SDI71698.1 hypothetical protein SAMN04488245_12316 [Alloyangia pacifica]SFT24819.1 hypothetical protein SAMN04488050_12016 [Alloyangia pacifica]